MKTKYDVGQKFRMKTSLDLKIDNISISKNENGSPYISYMMTLCDENGIERYIFLDEEIIDMFEKEEI